MIQQQARTTSTLALAMTATVALALSAGAAWAQQQQQAQQEPEQVWEATGFEAPESAVYDAEQDAIYVSNVVGGPMEKDGNGYISKLGSDGQVIEQKWATGLNGPTGMALHDGTLYVGDVDTLVAISTEDGKVADSWTASGAKFLNDVSADSQGRVFATDMPNNAIYVMENGEISQWLQSDDLMTPNGVHAEDDRLVIGAWGVLTGQDFQTDPAGHLKAVDLESKAVESIGSGEPVGNLDGVEPDGQGNYLVTDWMNGALLRISAEGEVEQLLDLNQGSADHEVIEDQNLVIIPMMNDGTVVAYRLQ